MARLFKQVYSKRMPDGSMKRSTGTAWIAEFRSTDGTVKRRSTKTGDKSAAQQLAAEWERQDVRAAAYGIDTRQAGHAQRLLSEHVVDWKKALLDKGTGQGHVDLSVTRVERILAAIKATRWADVDANKIAGYLADRRRKGLSIESSNHYTRRIKQFGFWMVRSGRATSTPTVMLTILNARTDQRHDRRALSPDELHRLINTTTSGPSRLAMDGPTRAMLYRLAVETGLRSTELRSLTVGSFAFDTDPPSVTVGAAYSKHRREDVQPIRPELAADLRKLFAGKMPGAIAFRSAKGSHLGGMIRSDLAAARAAWIAEAAADPTEQKRRENDPSFLAYRDDAGKVADFHALRHTFISNLARANVHPKVAQQLARHSTIGLTMDRYTHTVLGDLSDALTSLPDLRSDPSRETQQRATGTHGKASVNEPMKSAPRLAPRGNPTERVESVASCVAFPVAFTPNSPGPMMSSADIESGVCLDRQGSAKNPDNTGEFDTSWQSQAMIGSAGSVRIPGGSHGLQSR